MARIWGWDTLKIICLFLFIISAIAVFYRIIKSHFSIGLILTNLVILVSGFIFAWQQPYLVEKMHVLEYGLLGWLSLKDTSKHNTLKRAVFLAILFVLFIGSLDEWFQKLLPYRVGEMRDVYTNLISGILGIILYLAR